MRKGGWQKKSFEKIGLRIGKTVCKEKKEFWLSEGWPFGFRKGGEETVFFRLTESSRKVDLNLKGEKNLEGKEGIGGLVFGLSKRK